MNPVRNETTRRTYQTQPIDQSIMQQGCHQSLRLHPLNIIFFTINDDSNEPAIPYGFGLFPQT